MPTLCQNYLQHRYSKTIYIKKNHNPNCWSNCWKKFAFCFSFLHCFFENQGRGIWCQINFAGEKFGSIKIWRDLIKTIRKNLADFVSKPVFHPGASAKKIVKQRGKMEKNAPKCFLSNLWENALKFYKKRHF